MARRMRNQGNALRRLAVVVLCLAGILSVVAVGGHAASTRDERIVVLLNGRGDLSFNDMAHKGVADAARDFGFQMEVVQNTTIADALPNLRNLARTGDYDLIISVGFLTADAMRLASEEFPEQRFAIVGGAVADRDNVMALLFREHEMSALIGALAGLAAAHHGYDAAGIVLGVEIPTLYHFEAGFRFGVAWAAETYQQTTGRQAKIELLYTYTGTFSDLAIGKAATEAMLAQGAVGVYNVAGAVGLGDLEAIHEAHQFAGTRVGPPYYFGVDANQDYLGGGCHGLASGMKRVDRAVYNAIVSVLDGTFTGGITSFGLAEGGVGISKLQDLVDFIGFGVESGEIDAEDLYPIVNCWAQNRSTLPAWIWTSVEALEVAILDGSVVVPTANSAEEIAAIRAVYPGNSD